jgi:predicted CopG family antitoxin
MYIHIHNMAKTLMISNEVYDALKSIKGEKSFSELIKTILPKRKKNGNDIAEMYGVLKGDKEYDKIKDISTKKWGEWTKKYV